MAKPHRLPSTRRAVPDNHLVEINQVAATTGDDPELDTGLLPLHTETVCRRGGALALRPADLDPDQRLILLRERRDGPLAAGLAHPDDPPDPACEQRHAPPGRHLLRYASGQPITSRRYDHLWARIGRHLPGRGLSRSACTGYGTPP